MRTNTLACWAVALAAGLTAAPLAAQDYPSKPIRMILPFPPGGPTDILGRIIGAKMSESMGQPIVYDNRPGAGGNIGAEIAAKAPPDGYSFVLCAPSIAISPSLYAKLPYDPQRDLTPVAQVAVIHQTLNVHPSVPAKTLSELVRLARANPGKLNFGSGGAGTSGHMAMELFKVTSKLDMVHVPYKGSNAATLAMIGGQVELVVLGAAASLPYIRQNRVRSLAVLSPSRHPVLPEVPTTSELGFADFQVQTWYGILTRAGTPAERVRRLNAEIVKAMNSPDVKARLEKMGTDVQTGTIDEFGAFLRAEHDRWARVIKAAGIRVQ